MVSPGKLRALSTLTDGEHNAFEPPVDETGEITYPRVEQALDKQDGEPVDFLETMTDRGILASEVKYKLYRCPNCSRTGMRYSTGCPNCESVRTTQESTAVHPSCDTPLEQKTATTAETTPEETDEKLYCSDCAEDVSATELENDRRYRCHDCTEWFDSPTHRLWCPDCEQVSPPAEVHEEPAYRYPLTTFGNQWIATQVERRQLLVAAFEERGYETSVETTIPTSAGGELPVHVYAVDELFDYRIVAGVHDSPPTEDVQRLVEAAREVDAQPILLLSDDAGDDRVAELVDREEITVVAASDGTLSGEFEMSSRSRASNLVGGWFDSLFSTAKR